MRGTVKSFTLKQKIKILKFFDQPGMSRKAVQEKFDLTESTLRGFIRNKTQLFEKFQCSSVLSSKRKRNREGAFPELEQAVTMWVSSKKKYRGPCQAKI